MLSKINNKINGILNKNKLNDLTKSVKKDLFYQIFMILIFSFLMISTTFFYFIREYNANMENFMNMAKKHQSIQKDIKNNDIIGLKKIIDYKDIKRYYIKIDKDFLFSDFDIGYINDGKVYIFKYPDLLKEIMMYIIALISFLDIIFIIYIIRIAHKVQLDTFIINKSQEATLSNKNMSILTENISHEAKTPLMIISNVFEEMENELRNGITCDLINNKRCVQLDKKYNDLKQKIELFKINVNAIYNIIERIHTFKTIKHSNGNKSIYDIIESSKMVMTLYERKKIFDIEIDERLKEYHLLSITNEDLLNITTNLFKNSIEAFATKLKIKFEKYQNGYVYIHIIDNGNGIEDFNNNKIFEPHFSTKENGEIRGVGLYLSKEILIHNNSDINMIYSEKGKGTIFELKLNAEKF